MANDSYHYPDVPDICAELQTEGQVLSAKRVRARRGYKGSYTWIVQDVNRWKRAQGLLTDDDPHEMPDVNGGVEDQEDGEELPGPPTWTGTFDLPAPAPARVEALLRDLREEGKVLSSLAHLEMIPAALQCFMADVDEARSWLNRSSGPLSEVESWTRISADIGNVEVFRRQGAQIATAAAMMHQELRRQYDLARQQRHPHP